MRRLQELLCAVVLGGSAVAGCYGTSEAYVVDDSPPPIREETVVYRPGFFWVHGHWLHRGGRWAWNTGYYERERPGYVYVEGRWEHRGRGHVWVNGNWRPR